MQEVDGSSPFIFTMVSRKAVMPSLISIYKNFLTFFKKRLTLLLGDSLNFSRNNQVEIVTPINKEMKYVQNR